MVKGCVALLIFAAAGWGATENAVGFVLEVHGQWLINGKPVTQGGGSIPPNATIDLPPQTNFRSGQTWRICIVLLNNSLLKYSCNSYDSCRKVLPAHAPASLTEPSPLLERIRTAIGRLISSDPDRYVPAISRGPAEPNQHLHDTVLPLNGDRLELRDWFAGVKPGEYALTFEYIGWDGASRPPVDLAFKWGASPPAGIAAPKLLPGLYRVRIYDSAGESVSPDAWVAIVDAAAFSRASAAFRDDRRAAEAWQSQDPEAAETFLRACLDNLAPKQPTRQDPR
jgi:hypothetical protein